MPTILISGGTSGLGLALCQKFLQENYQVFTFSNDRQKVLQSKKNLKNPNFDCFYGDICDYEFIEKIVQEISTIDILINNAGVWLEGDLVDFEPSKIQEVININLVGQIFLTQVVLKKMLKVNSGIIFNVASTSGVFAKPKQTVYCASKFGLQGFTESLKLELKETKIKVFGFYPSGMQTEFFSADKSRDTKEYIKTGDIADLIFFLTKNSHKYKVDHLIVNRN